MHEAPKEMSLPSDGGAFADGFTRMGHRTQSWDSEAEGGQEGVNPVRVTVYAAMGTMRRIPKVQNFDLLTFDIAVASTTSDSDRQ